MPTNTVYYLGRVIKLSNLRLNPHWIYEAFQKPKPVYWWHNAWSFFDVEMGQIDGVDFVCAKLSKFNPEGEVIIADTDTQQEIVQPEPNLQIASSYFVYIPSVSGIAFAKVTNQINEFQFQRLFCRIINETLFERLAECEIEFITDLHTFAEKILSLDRINSISAQVYPPNPLFGPLWEGLKEYIRTRRSEKMLIRESSSPQEGLKTQLPSLVEKAANQPEDKPYIPDQQPAIGDAAILMAADGYGSGQVTGISKGESITIKTSKTVKNFSMKEDHTSEELFIEAYKIYKKIETDRHMKH